jgi:hypothetical protein
MWRRKDKEAIKDHTARMTGDRSEEAVQDAPNIITLADFKKKK